MKTTITKLITLIAGLMMLATVAMAQNMDKYITLTVVKGSTIMLSPHRDAGNIILIRNGSTDILSYV